MDSLCPDQRNYLDALVAEHGAGKLQEYINEKFTPTIIHLRRMSPANAHTWIDLDAFVDWLVQDCQGPSRASRSRPPASLTVYIKTLTGGNMVISSLMSSPTVEAMKSVIEERTGVPSNEQRLIFAGKQLENYRTLADYQIHEGSTLHLVTKMRGGKPVIYLISPQPIEATARLSLTCDWSISAIYPIVPIADKEGGQTLEWNVQTRADGTLHELNTRLDVSYLFWEALTNSAVDTPPPSPTIAQAREVFRPGTTGVSNEDSVLLAVADVTPYLDKVLAALGLHVEARTSFITYWLPNLLKHTHVALRFLDQAAYARAAPLDVSPQPDVVTRIFMLFRGVKEVELCEWEGAQARATDAADMWQEIVRMDPKATLDENLFRVIEWGGMEVFH